MQAGYHDPYRDALRFEVTEDEVTLRAARTGNLSDMHFALQGDLLTVWGHGANGHRDFCRSLRLPGPVSASHAEVTETADEIVVHLPRPGATRQWKRPRYH